MAKRVLDEKTIQPDPVRQFRRWFRDAANAGLPMPETTALATATRDGRPSVRMVLLKGFDRKGFVFFTNYRSRKGKELIDNPRAELAFWWGAMERQVRIEGRVERVSSKESDAYFRSRPRESQIGAHVSQQSEVIESREILERAMRAMSAEFAGSRIPRPPHWGGFRIVPELVEFWQGREARMHDRIRYTRGRGKSWRIQRLAP
jgi:pyridoxamine 5'-phosphate oxidase